MNYIMLRMLGLQAEHPVLARAREVLSALGGVLGIQTWGKFWLCVLSLYEWEGMVPLPPEVLLVASNFPMNPTSWWMPLRNIFISMSYLYGHRFKAPETALTESLRKEPYPMHYSEIDWHAQRLNVGPSERFKPRTPLQSATALGLGAHEACKVRFFRKRALTEALFQVEAEVDNTGYLRLTPGGPLCFRDRRFVVWDMSMSVQAICASGSKLQHDDIQVLQRAATMLVDAQIRQDPLAMDHIYRHPSNGGWPFSTRAQGYAVSDTTAEALSATLYLQQLGAVPDMPTDRLEKAVDLLLGFESRGGGFAAYEQVRTGDYLELYDITDSYENCMVESRYPECTGSVVLALHHFTSKYPKYRAGDINQSIERGAQYLLRA
ncbi:terpenoid cyclases/Protein prenyltransferase [Colletotrichum somersetense]|nr:terpenoid cyclases/Protein prenyltransferase [Colletotrichum somersetense]